MTVWQSFTSVWPVFGWCGLDASNAVLVSPSMSPWFLSSSPYQISTVLSLLCLLNQIVSWLTSQGQVMRRNSFRYQLVKLLLSFAIFTSIRTQIWRDYVVFGGFGSLVKDCLVSRLCLGSEIGICFMKSFCFSYLLSQGGGLVEVTINNCFIHTLQWNENINADLNLLQRMQLYKLMVKITCGGC